MMGYGANFAEIIKKETVREICTKEYDALMDTIAADKEFDFVKFSQYIKLDNPTTLDIDKAYDELIEAFNKATRLELLLSHHDSETDGDSYDEVDGPYWHVGLMYVLTLAGEKMKDKVERKFFVSFG